MTQTKDDFFVPENALLDQRDEHWSPSGQYRLVVTPYRTKPGAWEYTLGCVYRFSSDTPIAEVRRNYHRFPFLFIEDHRLGHPLLVCGSDYQGQTVVDLDTGRVRDSMSDGAKQGAGFCWASYRFHAPSRILIVAGCYWACPYEYKFFDFTDPLEKGWPELECGMSIDDSGKWPEIDADGTVRCFDVYPEPDDYDGEADLTPEQRGIRAVQVFKRDGNKLVAACPTQLVHAEAP